MERELQMALQSRFHAMGIAADSLVSPLPQTMTGTFHCHRDKIEHVW